MNAFHQISLLIKKMQIDYSQKIKKLNNSESNNQIVKISGPLFVTTIVFS